MPQTRLEYSGATSVRIGLHRDRCLTQRRRTAMLSAIFGTEPARRGVVDSKHGHGARRIAGATETPVAFTFEGESLEAAPSDTVASALLASGIRSFSITEGSASSRGGFCFM